MLRVKGHLEYKSIVAEINGANKNRMVTFCQFVDLLNANNIKFYCQQDIYKINRMFGSSLDKLRVSELFSYLQFHTVTRDINITNFFVKFSGRNASTHNLSDSPHKWTVIHPLSNCLGALKKLMLSLYGPEPNWLQYFGGHLGTSSIKREDLHKKVRTLLKNTEHHLCINRILYYLSGYPSDMEAQIEWITVLRNLRRKIVRERKAQTLPSESPKLKSLQRNRSSFIRQVITRACKEQEDSSQFLQQLIKPQQSGLEEEIKKHKLSILKKSRRKTVSNFTRRQITLDETHRKRSKVESHDQKISEELSEKGGNLPILHSYVYLHDQMNSKANKKKGDAQGLQKLGETKRSLKLKR